MHEDRPHSHFWTIYFELQAIQLLSNGSPHWITAVYIGPSGRLVTFLTVHFNDRPFLLFLLRSLWTWLRKCNKIRFLYENDLFYTNCFAILKSGRFVQRQKRPSLCRFWLIQWCPYEINVQLTTIYMLTISWLPADFHLRT